MYSLRHSALRFLRSAIPAQQSCQKHTLPPLPYKYDALEPVISCEIMELHHTKHHQAYVDNLNKAEEELKEAIGKKDTTKMISLMKAINFNGGGHINHTIFWETLSSGETEPSKELLDLLCATFKTLDNLKDKMSAMATGIQGSGWAWMGYNKQSKSIHLATTANQDPLEATTGLVPLFGIDVWEHAYYLQYQNRRAEYAKKIFDVVNWKAVSKRLEDAC